MAQKLIRDIPDEIMNAIEEKAQSAGKNAEAYIRDLLIQIAAEPIVKDRYALRFYCDSIPARGLIRRFSDHVNGVSGGADNLSAEQMDAYQKAKDLMRRNAPGDREEAIFLLKTHFDNVFEVPV